jgi:hypothetical protein
MKKKKKIKRRQRPACGLCGSKTNLIRTECCEQWICNDETEYVPFSYARNSCYRNHLRYTLCGYHYIENHSGDWKTCPECRDNFSDNLEMYVYYGTNEYNFEKLPNPPAFEPTYCSECGKRIVMADGGYSYQGDKYTCGKCDSSPIDQLMRFNPLRDSGLDDVWDNDDEDEDWDDFEEDRPIRLSSEEIDDIPESLLPRFDEISRLLGQFCMKYDSVEFALLCMDMNISICVHFPEVISKGKPESWACGIVHALGMVNFLSDPSFEPYIKSSEMYPFFGISQATMQSKSKQIRNLFGTFQMDPMWSLPVLLLQNPMLWMVPMNGTLVDIRDEPPEIQQEALEMGLIPIGPDELKQQLDEQKQIINETLSSLELESDAAKPKSSSSKKPSKSNIKIVDYFPTNPVNNATPETLPLFDQDDEK